MPRFDEAGACAGSRAAVAHPNDCGVVVVMSTASPSALLEKGTHGDHGGAPRTAYRPRMERPHHHDTRPAPNGCSAGRRGHFYYTNPDAPLSLSLQFLGGIEA